MMSINGLPTALITLGHTKHISAGEYLFFQGGAAEVCYYLQEGEIAVRRSGSDGEEIEIARIQAGQWLGEAVMLAHARYPGAAVAVRDSICLSFPRATLSGTTAEGVQEYLVGLLAQKCLQLNHRIEQLTLTSARERLVRFLLELCPSARTGCDGSRPGPCTFPLPRAKREIAIQLGMTPETLSRQFRQLEADGLIHMSGSKLKVDSCQALRSVLK